MNQITDTNAVSLLACDDGFDPIEDRLRANIRSTIEAVFNEELDGFLGRLRYGREAGAVKGYRHGQAPRLADGVRPRDELGGLAVRQAWPAADP